MSDEANEKPVKIPCDRGGDHEYVGLPYIGTRLGARGIATFKSWIQRGRVDLPSPDLTIGRTHLWARAGIDEAIDEGRLTVTPDRRSDEGPKKRIRRATSAN